nr:hypothetical protein [Pseudomonas sp. Ga0074129]
MPVCSALLATCLIVTVLVGCQSTREQMMAEGFPAPFIDGFEAGCGSGRQAAGALDRFRKDVPRYLQQPEYAQGWDDGFRQCKEGLDSAIELELRDNDKRDRDWREHVDQAMAKAMRGL